MLQNKFKSSNETHFWGNKILCNTGPIGHESTNDSILRPGRINPPGGITLAVSKIALGSKAVKGQG